MNMSGEKNHEVVENSLDILENLDHRGARGAEENTGDGAGILIQKPHRFFQKEIPEISDKDFNEYGVAQIFLPKNDEERQRIKNEAEDTARKEGFNVITWRDVPTDNSDLGKTARRTEPEIQQLFIEPKEDKEPSEIDTALYLLRREIENKVESSTEERFYICSMDRRKIVYKGLLTNSQVKTYYPDLSDEDIESSLALVHSRFSTNTLGSWELAHPYRNIIHNGEINTLRGNLNWMATRENDLESPVFGDGIDKIKPVTHENQSDTAVVDNVLELLVEGGRDITHALRMLIPEAWNKDHKMDETRKKWYDYHSTIVEPWDGPALVAFTDGYRVGAVLDRNGLRPCRYWITEDDQLIMSSETGVLDVDDSNIKKKERLKPGQMFLADPEQGRIIPDEEIFDTLTNTKYGEWLDEQRVKLTEVVEERGIDSHDTQKVKGDITRHLKAFGYTDDHVEDMIEPMVVDGKDPVGSMGNDTPLSAMSSRNKTLFTYFKQLFAQVSNPPIDHIREDLVTSLESHIGRQRNMLGETPEHCHQVKLDSPVIRDDELKALTELDSHGLESRLIDITYPRDETSLRDAVEQIKTDAVEAIQSGAEILVLSDRATDSDRVAIPSLLAVGGLHHHLIREGLRTRTAIVLESAQPCVVHHFCTLIGYGADAVNPYLAFQTIEEYILQDAETEKPVEDAIEDYIHAVEHGVLKVMSKMGISTLESYKGAQIFEAVGLDSDFVDEFFNGTKNRTEGIDLEDLERDIYERHDFGFREEEDELDPGGELRWKREGEVHAWYATTVRKLQSAVQEEDYETYKEFSDLMNDGESLTTLRGLMDFDSNRDPVPVEEVEPVEDIVKRFFTGSMSFGSLSKEAHETIAIAMNRLGAKSGSGEGGEPMYRFGTERRSKIKQVASGRFGVTIDYLNDGDHLEIKMAQGSKPGEGGHLPGHKVNEIIAETRHTTPGVALISPPPHHDIYSIEDLAQLIYDLKSSNPDADVHVKLVSEDGVGIIAAGVAKARADSVLISGHSGGTGASPRTSIKSAGLPWELGVTEAHRILMENRLRSRIRVRVDGGMTTGRDVVVAALLGAEEFGFGTSALVAEGCIMVRICHTNECPTGIATQDPEKRKKFSGEVEHVMNYMKFMAQETRELMAELGFRSIDEMVGRMDVLKQRDVDHPRAKNIDLSGVLEPPRELDDPRKTQEQNHQMEERLDYDLIEEAQPAIQNGESVKIHREIRNRDRTVGATLSSEISRSLGDDEELDDHTITVNFTGSAGQSFGAFLSKGVTMNLVGDANDYVGKGMSGGKIAVKTPSNAGFEAHENILIGNVALYGATDGEAYFNGNAGERFAVRNSGVKTVVEGVGDHGCEYMTGGIAVILGETGKNFAAGMSGGEAYVLDEDGDFESRVNKDMVHLEGIDDERDRGMVKRMIENHHRYTGSKKAKEVLDNWESYVDRFVKVMPDAYHRVIEEKLGEGEDIRQSPPPSPKVVEGIPTKDD